MDEPHRDPEACQLFPWTPDIETEEWLAALADEEDPE